MTASDARTLAQDLVRRSDDALAALFSARQISPTVGWNDAFDAAEALLEPAALERALVGLTADEVAVLTAGAPAPAGALTDGLRERGLLDEQGLPYDAVSAAIDAVAARAAASVVVPDDAPADRDAAAAAAPGDARAAERAFASLGSLADILHAALTHPFARIGAGTLGAADRRRLIETGIVDDPTAADELMVIAERTGMLAGQDKTWAVTARGAHWLHTDTVSRWAEVAHALLQGLPRGVRRDDGGGLLLLYTSDAADDLLRVYLGCPRHTKKKRITRIT